MDHTTGKSARYVQQTLGPCTEPSDTPKQLTNKNPHQPEFGRAKHTRDETRWIYKTRRVADGTGQDVEDPRQKMI